MTLFAPLGLFNPNRLEGDSKMPTKDTRKVLKSLDGTECAIIVLGDEVRARAIIRDLEEEIIAFSYKGRYYKIPLEDIPDVVIGAAYPLIYVKRELSFYRVF